MPLDGLSLEEKRKQQALEKVDPRDTLSKYNDLDLKSTEVGERTLALLDTPRHLSASEQGIEKQLEREAEKNMVRNFYTGGANSAWEELAKRKLDKAKAAAKQESSTQKPTDTTPNKKALERREKRASRLQKGRETFKANAAEFADGLKNGYVPYEDPNFVRNHISLEGKGRFAARRLGEQPFLVIKDPEGDTPVVHLASDGTFKQVATINTLQKERPESAAAILALRVKKVVRCKGDQTMPTVLLTGTTDKKECGNYTIQTQQEYETRLLETVLKMTKTPEKKS